VPSQWTEEEVKIVVVRTAGAALTEPELAEYLAARMPRFMVPRYIEFTEELVKTPTQKVRKDGLRRAGVTDRTWDGEAARV
jgi:crotonobetaine/carnitine-CoA ligase